MEKYIGLKLDIELVEKIKKFATETQRSCSAVVRLALIEFFERRK
jgi:predicted transcriptional regulator